MKIKEIAIYMANETKKRELPKNDWKGTSEATFQAKKEEFISRISEQYKTVKCI